MLKKQSWCKQTQKNIQGQTKNAGYSRNAIIEWVRSLAMNIFHIITTFYWEKMKKIVSRVNDFVPYRF
jgi:hypothetical protein